MEWLGISFGLEGIIKNDWGSNGAVNWESLGSFSLVCTHLIWCSGGPKKYKI